MAIFMPPSSCYTTSRDFTRVVDLEYLQGVAPGDLRELIASLMTHHLRLAGKMETVSRETLPSSPANDGNTPAHGA